MTISVTVTTAIKRTYPHVSEVQDWTAQASLRLLWDRLHDLTEQLQAVQATIDELIDGHNTNEATLDSVGQDVRQALAGLQSITNVSGSAGSGSAALPGGGDGGGGGIGCSAAGATGHDTGGLLNPIRAGQLVCGTGNEFSALLVATPDLATRDVNKEELLLRMIWHLRLGGFTAGRQQNPSGAISNDKLCVVVDGITRAYDTMIGSGNFASAMTTGMSEVAPPNMIDDPGIPD